MFYVFSFKGYKIKYGKNTSHSTGTLLRKHNDYILYLPIILFNPSHVTTMATKDITDPVIMPPLFTPGIMPTMFPPGRL